MTKGKISRLREAYHDTLFKHVLRVNESGAPNNADGGSRSSVKTAKGIIERIGLEPTKGHIPGQTAGQKFEEITRDFLREAFVSLKHMRPGDWEFSLGENIQRFEQYRHLADVSRLIETHRELRTVFSDYIVTPDIVVCRKPVGNDTINTSDMLVGDANIAAHTPLRKSNSDWNILHASVSCKWTLRRDRSQNARTEGLNLIRNRKGKSPHIVVVTAEPLPSRLASLALGTGDIDCVYHFALPELQGATSGETDIDLLNTLVEGSRLRDISDLPFDLAA